MARTSKSRGATPYSLRSGNSSTFKMMGSTSPIRDEKTTIAGDYKNTVDAVSSFTGNKAQLRQFVLDNNKGKKASDKSRISQDMAIKLWRQNNAAENNSETPNVNDEKEQTRNEKASRGGGVVPRGTAEKLAEKYGYGPDPSGNRAEEIKRLRI